jgi:hypothetical protein
MNREDQEAALALALMAAWKKFQDKDQISWLQFQAAIRPALAEHLTSIYMSSAQQEAGGNDLPHLEQAAEQWAGMYAKRLAAEIAETSRQQIEAAKRRRDEEELALALAIAFSSGRASTISATETTYAITNGQRSAVSYLDRLLGRRSIAYWQCEPDCCDICDPLDDEPPDVWADMFPEGPPGHPNCRCWLEYRTSSQFCMPVRSKVRLEQLWLPPSQTCRAMNVLGTSPCWMRSAIQTLS